MSGWVLQISISLEDMCCHDVIVHTTSEYWSYLFTAMMYGLFLIQNVVRTKTKCKSKPGIKSAIYNFPSSIGSTWTSEMVWLLRNNLDFGPETHHITDRVPFLE